MVEPVETHQVGEYTVRIIYDTEPDSPRVLECLGRCWFWHRHYNLGDPDEAHPFRFSLSDCQSWDDVEARIQRAYPGAIVLPVYLYDHSIQRLSTEPWTGRAQHADWDSGQIGVIYALPDWIRDWFGVRRITKRIQAQAEDVLRAEIADLDRYVSGDVYAYEIERAGELLEVVGTWYGLDQARSAAFEVLEGVSACTTTM